MKRSWCLFYIFLIFQFLLFGCRVKKINDNSLNSTSTATLTAITPTTVSIDKNKKLPIIFKYLIKNNSKTESLLLDSINIKPVRSNKLTGTIKDNTNNSCKTEKSKYAVLKAGKTCSFDIEVAKKDIKNHLPAGTTFLPFTTTKKKLTGNIQIETHLLNQPKTKDVLKNNFRLEYGQQPACTVKVAHDNTKDQERSFSVTCEDAITHLPISGYELIWRESSTVDHLATPVIQNGQGQTNNSGIFTPNCTYKNCFAPGDYTLKILHNNTEIVDTRTTGHQNKCPNFANTCHTPCSDGGYKITSNQCRLCECKTKTPIGGFTYTALNVSIEKGTSFPVKVRYTIKNKATNDLLLDSISIPSSQNKALGVIKNNNCKSNDNNIKSLAPNGTCAFDIEVTKEEIKNLVRKNKALLPFTTTKMKLSGNIEIEAHLFNYTKRTFSNHFSLKYGLQPECTASAQITQDYRYTSITCKDKITDLPIEDYPVSWSSQPECMNNEAGGEGKTGINGTYKPDCHYAIDPSRFNVSFFYAKEKKHVIASATHKGCPTLNCDVDCGLFGYKGNAQHCFICECDKKKQD